MTSDDDGLEGARARAVDGKKRNLRAESLNHPVVNSATVQHCRRQRIVRTFRQIRRLEDMMTYAGLDYQILELLRRDGRASLRTIAQRLEVSTSTVSHRVKQLEDAGIIRGYQPIIDYSKLGYRLTAITKIKARGAHIPKIVQKLVKEETLIDVYEITGDYDVLVIGKYADEEMMNREIKRLLSLPEIESTNTSMVLSVAKEGGDLALGPTPK